MQAQIIEQDALVRTESADVIRKAHAAGRPMWVELGESSPEAERLLAETFGVHPLVIEDIFGERSVPKIDPYDGYIYVVVHALRQSDDPTRADMGVLDLVIGDTFILTQHREGPATDKLRGVLEQKPGLLAKGVAWVAHAFIDAIVDRFLPFMEALRKRIDDLELHVMQGVPSGRDLLPELVALKRSVQALCRITDHQREILRNLSTSTFAHIPKETRPYFRDVYDHFTRVAEEAENSKDVVTNTVDAYLSVQSNRMNETVKRLTLLSTVMLPLNLIAGFYGMNFTWLPGTTWRWGFLYVVGLMLGVTLAVWAFFKRRGWA